MKILHISFIGFIFMLNMAFGEGGSSINIKSVSFVSPKVRNVDYLKEVPVVSSINVVASPADWFGKKPIGVGGWVTVRSVGSKTIAVMHPTRDLALIGDPTSAIYLDYEALNNAMRAQKLEKLLSGEGCFMIVAGVFFGMSPNETPPTLLFRMNLIEPYTILLATHWSGMVKDESSPIDLELFRREKVESSNSIGSNKQFMEDFGFPKEKAETPRE